MGYEIGMNLPFRNSVTATLLFLLSACAPKIALSPAALEAQKTHFASGSRYAIASPGTATGLAAKRVLDQGGNLIDAAVAASFAVSVERPQSTGLGGGGFMVFKLAGQKDVLAIDFREQAPLLAHEEMYLDAKKEVVKNLSTDGVKAAAVPGLVAGLFEIHQKYGKLPLATVMAPAIELAEQGFEVYPHLADALKERRDVLAQYEGSKKIFLRADGQALQKGDVLKQPDLARTLREISAKGKEGFYKGWVAQALIAQQKKLGGLISQEDLDGYQIKYRKPVHGTYKGLEVYAMPPPSSGGVHVIEMLNILEGDALRGKGPLSPRAVHLTSSAMQMAFADRAKYLGDPDFVRVPVDGLISKAYAKKLRESVPENLARTGAQVSNANPFAFESDNTTHISLMDEEGNAVATTQTVNGAMGAGVVVEGAGFVLNNEMDDFSIKPGVANMYGVLGGKENSVQPRKRPLSSMSPTLVFKEGRPVLAIGSPGGPRIISCVLLSMLNYLEYGLPLYESLALLRYHHQWSPDEIRVESPFFAPALEEELTSKYGYKVNHSNYKCSVQAVAYEKGKLKAASDPRDVGLSIAGGAK